MAKFSRFSSTEFMKILDFAVNYCIVKHYMPDNFRLTDHFNKYNVTQEQIDDLAKTLSDKYGLVWTTTKCYGSESLLTFMSIPFQYYS